MKTLTKTSDIVIVQFLTLLLVVSSAPLLNNQLIVGPIVNMVLFMAIIVIGLPGAYLLAVTPSLIALTTGLLAFYPMVPLIITSNFILITVFNKLKKNYWLGIFSASLTKALFLGFSSWIILGKLSIFFSWIQLLTALSGGILCFIYLKWTSQKNTN
jgi:hypothetical protein